jgi:multiple antibiotic resistance protein
MEDAQSSGQHVLALGGVFTLFMVTLGPLKLLGPVARLTRGLDPGAQRAIALRAFLVSLVSLFVGGFLGKSLMAKWHVSVESMLLAGGVVFFLVALTNVMEPYRTVAEPAETLPEQPLAAALRLAFPFVVTPYGVTALIVLWASSHSNERLVGVLGVLLAILLLDLLALLYARWILSHASLAVALKVIGVVLAVLQIGLATEMILLALRALGVLEA